MTTHNAPCLRVLGHIPLLIGVALGASELAKCLHSGDSVIESNTSWAKSNNHKADASNVSIAVMEGIAEPGHHNPGV